MIKLIAYYYFIDIFSKYKTDKIKILDHFYYKIFKYILTSDKYIFI